MAVDRCQSGARRFAGHLALWTFIVVFTALWLLSFNGAPPPTVHVLVTVDLILFPIGLGWAYWIDRLRHERDLRVRITRKPKVNFPIADYSE